MRVWHTVMVAVLPVLSLSSSARVWRVVGFSSTKLFGAWQSWVFSSCIYGIVSSCQNNTNTRKVELKFCVDKGWSKHQFPSKMAGGRRGLVAPQNTFLENIIRRSSQQRKIQWSSLNNYKRLWLLNHSFWDFQRVKIFILVKVVLLLSCFCCDPTPSLNFFEIVKRWSELMMIDEEVSLHIEEIHIIFINFEKVASLIWTFRNILKSSTRWNYFFLFQVFNFCNFMHSNLQS